MRQAFFIVEPNQEEVIRIAHILDAGSLRTVVDRVLPLAQISAAYTGEVRERRGRGKLVVEVGAQEGAP